MGVAAAVFIPWSWRRSVGVGFIELGDTELRVVAKGGTQIYNWADIGGIRKASPVEMKGSTRLVYQLFRCDIRKTVAVLSLKTWLKADPLRRRWGTRLFGIPLFAHEVMVFPEDVDGFVEATKRFMLEKSSRDWDEPFRLDAGPVA